MRLATLLALWQCGCPDLGDRKKDEQPQVSQYPGGICITYRGAVACPTAEEIMSHMPGARIIITTQPAKKED